MPKTIFKKSLSFFLSLILLGTLIATPAYATPEEDELDKIQEELRQIEEDKKDINSQIDQESAIQNELTRELTTLRNKINLLETEITETELTIKELQIQIQLLEKEISQKEIDMNTAKIEINDLEDETDVRLVEMYIEKKTSSEMDMIFSTSATNLIKLSSYHSSLQEETNELLGELEVKKAQLDTEKTSLEEARVQVSRDEVSVIEKKVSLEKDKASIDSQRAVYIRKRNESLRRADQQENLMDLLEESEKQALADQDRLIEEMINSMPIIPTDTYVTKGTIIGRQGCSGLCTGPHLHFGVKYNGGFVNPCNVLGPNQSTDPNNPNETCGDGSGPLKFPMNGTYNITSWYRTQSRPTHNGIDISNYLSGAPVYAAHSGYIEYFTSSCTPRVNIPCNGPLKWARVCENENCNSGYQTWYLHFP